MAVKNLYIVNATASGSNHGSLQDGGTVPTLATTGTGWTVGANAAGNEASLDWGVEVARTVFATTAMPASTIDNSIGDCVRSDNTISGTFDAGNWVLKIILRAVTAGGAFDGYVKARLWKGSNATGSGATEFGALTNGTAVTNLATTADQASTVTWSSLSAQTFTNEYLFVQMALEVTGAGGGNTHDALIRVGTSGANTTGLVTTNFTASTVLTWNGGGTLTTAGALQQQVQKPLAGALTLVGRSLALGGDYATEVAADNPVSHYRVGEPAGTVAYDNGSNGLDGTYTGGYTLGATGALSGDANTAVTLDGSSGYIALASDADLNITGPWTFEAWIKTTTTIAHANLYGGYHDGNWNGVGLRLNNGRLDYFSSDGGDWRTSGPSGLNDGEWHHVVVTVSGSTLTHYVDGQQAGVDTGAAQPSSYSGVRAIGARSSGTAEYFPGDIDEVAIYSGALSATRVQDHYDAGAPSGPVTWNGGGTLSSAGALVKQGSRALAGSVTVAGAITRQVQKALPGALTTAGALASSRVSLLSLAGTLTTAGAVARSVATRVAGTLSAAGALLKETRIRLTGGLTTAGALSSSTGGLPFRDDFTSAVSGSWDVTDTSAEFGILNQRLQMDSGGAADWTSQRVTYDLALTRSDLGAFLGMVRLTNNNSTDGGLRLSLSPSSTNPTASGAGSISTDNQGAGNYRTWASGLQANSRSTRSIDYLWAVVVRPGGGFFLLISGGEYGTFPAARLVNVTNTEADATLYAHLATRQSRGHWDYAAILPSGDLPAALQSRFGPAAAADDFTASNGTTIDGRTVPYGTGTWDAFGNTVEVQGNAAAISSLGRMVVNAGTVPRVIDMTFTWSGSGSIELLFRGDGTYNNSWVMWYWSGSGTINFERASSGGGGTVASAGDDPVVGTNTMRVIDHGTSLEGFLNGVLVLSISSTNNNTQTHVGAASGEDTQTVLDFAAWPASVTLNDDFGPGPDPPPYAPTATTASDAFTDTNGTSLPTHHADWTVNTGTWEVNSNRARMTASGVAGNATRTATNANHVVRSLVGVPADPGTYPTDVYCGLIARRSASNSYLISRYLYQDGPSTEIEVWENNAGAQELIGYVNLTDIFSAAGDRTMTLSCLDAETAAYDGTELVVQATTTVTTGVEAGIGVIDSNPGGQPTWDDFLLGPSEDAVVLTWNGGGTLTSAGAAVKQGQLLRSGALAGAGSLLKASARLLAGTLSASGLLRKSGARALSGALPSAGALTKASTRALAGALTSAGSVASQISGGGNLAFEGGGVLGTAGTVARATSARLAGSLAPAGGITRGIGTRVTATLSTSGLLLKVPSLLRAGTLVLSGTLVRGTFVALWGFFFPAGALRQSVSRTTGGSVGLGGGLALLRFKSVARGGTLTTSGAVSSLRLRNVGVGGGLGLSGALAPVRTRAPVPAAPEAGLLPEAGVPQGALMVEAAAPEGALRAEVAGISPAAVVETAPPQGLPLSEEAPPEYGSIQED